MSKLSRQPLLVQPTFKVPLPLRLPLYRRYLYLLPITGAMQPDGTLGAAL
jgi:hypothetical protein